MQRFSQNDEDIFILEMFKKKCRGLFFLNLVHGMGFIWATVDSYMKIIGLVVLLNMIRKISGVTK